MLTVTYAEFHMQALYAESRNPESRYAECRGAVPTATNTLAYYGRKNIFETCPGLATNWKSF